MKNIYSALLTLFLDRNKHKKRLHDDARSICAEEGGSAKYGMQAS